jgi:O-antigen ligase
MLNRFLHPKSHYYIHFVALSLFAVGIVCSKAFMSIGIFLGLLNLLLEANFKDFWFNLKQNRAFWLIGGLFLLHLLGLLWTSNFLEGIDDLRMKTSLVTVPLIVFAKAEWSFKLKEKILGLLLLTICFISLINVLTYFQFFGFREYTDMRQLSLFGSHIRFSLLIAFGIALSLFYVDKTKKYAFLLVVVYLVFYTLLSQVLSGLIAILVVFFAFGIFKLRQTKIKWIAWTVLVFVGFVLSAISIYLMIPPKKSVLPVNEEQLVLSWEKASKFSYFGKDKKNQPISSTLIRYMHSKELPADSIGFLKLTKEDIQEIERGTADINEKTPGFIGKLNEARFQIHSATNPNGSTIRQRLEYWKTGIQLIKENFIFGVGTGDIKDEYKKKYELNKSLLLPENRLEAHNTFLTFYITFGIIGFLYLIYFLVFSIWSPFKTLNFLGFAFILVITSSFFTEDTLETQMGITIFSFLFSLLNLKKETFKMADS